MILLISTVEHHQGCHIKYFMQIMHMMHLKYIIKFGNYAKLICLISISQSVVSIVLIVCPILFVSRNSTLKGNFSVNAYAP
jgi:hypothetical protein